MPGCRAVVEGYIEELFNLGDMRWVGNRDQHFHPAVEVAVHQVGRADPNRRRSIVGKPEEPTVLQETAQNAAYPNVVAEPGHTGSDRADAAYPKVHRNAGLRRAIKRIGRRLVHDRIDFDLDARRLSVFVVRDLVIDPVDQPVEDAVWGDEQPLVL